MRKGRFFYRVGPVRDFVDVLVEPGDTADFVARWALVMTNKPRRSIVPVAWRYLPEGA